MTGRMSDLYDINPRRFFSGRTGARKPTEGNRVDGLLLGVGYASRKIHVLKAKLTLPILVFGR